MSLCFQKCCETDSDSCVMIRMQRQLLSEVDLTFEKVLNICQAMKSANKNVRDFQKMLTDETAQVTRMHKGQMAVQRVSSAERKGQKKYLIFL